MGQAASDDSSSQQVELASIRPDTSTEPGPPPSASSVENLRRDLLSLHSAFDALTDGIIVADADGKFLVFNTSAKKILGFCETDPPPIEWPEVRGLYLPDRVTPYPTSDLPLTRPMRGENVAGVEVFVRNERIPGGISIHVSGMPLKDEAGRVIGGAAVLHDVSLQKDAMDLLQRLRSAVEQTADTVIISDREGTIEYVNDAFVTTTGYTRDEALGQTPRLLRSGVHDRTFYEQLWKTIKAGEPFRGIVVNRKKSGEFYHAEQTISPIVDSAGNITHFVSVTKDITDRLLRAEHESEMRVARTVQNALYPAKAPEIGGVDVAGAVYPAETMCGDYFDYLHMHGDCLGVVVGDVSGHGLGSALLMAEARAYLRSYARTQASVGEVLTWVNRTLAEDMLDGQYVTMLLACIDPVGRTLTYSNAGHPSGLVLDRSGAVRMELPSVGPPLGLFAETRFVSSRSIVLEAGDVVLLATDGIAETVASDDRDFDTEGVLASVRSRLDRPASEIVAGLYEDARAFAGDGRQMDDIAAIVIKFDL